MVAAACAAVAVAAHQRTETRHRVGYETVSYAAQPGKLPTLEQVVGGTRVRTVTTYRAKPAWGDPAAAAFSVAGLAALAGAVKREKRRHPQG